MAVATRPAVAVLFDVPLGYLADNCVGVDVIIDRVQVALMNAVNETTGVLSVTGLMGVVADVPGVQRVPRVLLNGDIVDLPAGEYVVDVPAEVAPKW